MLAQTMEAMDLAAKRFSPSDYCEISNYRLRIECQLRNSSLVVANKLVMLLLLRRWLWLLRPATAGVIAFPISSPEPYRRRFRTNRPLCKGATIRVRTRVVE
ncbi:hypothetical protein SLA2020_357670 [Shorea laevis]